MTTQKKVSKSQAKRVTAQKAAKSTPIEGEWTLPEAVEDRIAELEANQRILIDAFQFAANECRPIYGLGVIAVIFDAVAKKFKK